MLKSPFAISLLYKSLSRGSIMSKVCRDVIAAGCFWVCSIMNVLPKLAMKEIYKVFSWESPKAANLVSVSDTWTAPLVEICWAKVSNMTIRPRIWQENGCRRHTKSIIQIRSYYHFACRCSADIIAVPCSCTIEIFD